MNTTTKAIEENVNTFLLTAFNSNYSSFFFFIQSGIILFIIIPIFILRVISVYEHSKGHVPKAYTYRFTANLTKHRIIMWSVAAVSIFELIKSIHLSANSIVYDKWIIALGAVFIILGLITVILLTTFRTFGIVLLFAFLAYFTAYEELLLILKANALTDYSKNLSTISQYGVYASVDYVMAQGVILFIIVLAISVLLTVHYYRLRFLFMPEKLEMPLCPNCGKPIIKGEKICTCCGTRVENKNQGIDITPLDKEFYCHNCGADAKSCSCNGKYQIGRKVKNELKSKTKSFIGIVSFVALFGVIPYLNTASINLMHGVSAINNSFVESWDEFCESPERAYDENWLIDFNSRVNALYTFNSKWYHYDIKKLKIGELSFYQEYSNACFQQMQVLEEIYNFVNELDTKNNSSQTIQDICITLSTEFNQTIIEQSAVFSLSKPTGYTNLFDYAEIAANMIVGGLRLYFSSLDTVLIAYIFYSLGIIMLLFVLNGFSAAKERGIEGIYLVVRNKNNIFLDKIAQTKISPSPYTVMNIVRMLIRDICVYVAYIITNTIHLILAIITIFIRMFYLLRLIHFKRFCLWFKQGITNDRQRYILNTKQWLYQKKARLSMLAAYAFLVIVMIIVAMVSNWIGIPLDSDQAKKQYLEVSRQAAFTYSLDISDLLNKLNIGSLTEEETNLLIEICNRQIEADQEVINFDIDSIEGFEELHSGLCGLCNDDMIIVQAIKDSLENGIIPSQEQQISYARLRAETYKWILIKYEIEFLTLHVNSISMA